MVMLGMTKNKHVLHFNREIKDLLFAINNRCHLH